MGVKGRILRVVAPLLGSPFTFASLSEGRQTAEGQMDRETLFRLVETVRRGTTPNEETDQD
jgi:3-dehydroquinate dehydratase-1